MELKKPSILFNKKQSSVVFESSENSTNITETYDRFRDNLDKVNILSEKIEQISQQLSKKMTRTDLENAMLSHLMVLDENFKSIQNQVRGLNKEDLNEFKGNISKLTKIVGNLVENELPKYKRQITKNEVSVDEKINQFKEVVGENIVNIKGEIDTKFNNIAEVIDNNLQYFNNQIQETSSEVKKTSDTYNKLSKIVESRISKDNDKLEEYSQVIQSLHKSFVELEESFQEKTFAHHQVIEEKFETISFDVNNRIDIIDEDVNNRINIIGKDVKKKIVGINEEVNTIKDKVSSDILSIRANVVINEQHIKNVDKYLQSHHRELIELKEEVFGEIEQIPVGNIQENLERLEKKIDFIRETYSKIEPEVIVEEVIKEGLLNIPPGEKTSDPLSPLDQKFVTLDQLQEHYRLFINRIQQQLSTLGGSGETRLKYLDDVVGIATNASAYNGMFLKYDHSTSKFIFDASVSSISDTIISWYYTNKSKNISTLDDTAPSAVYVGASGTAMFVIGDTNNRIFQYTLSTPYDVSTAGVAITSFSTATQETNPNGIDFNTTGTKMFVSGQTAASSSGLTTSAEYVHEYSLSTAWNVAPSSVGYTTSYNITQDTTPNAVIFGNSGSKMYVVGNTNDTVYQYSLSTPYSLASGVTYDNISLVLGTNPLLLETNPSDISFNSAGTVVWVIGSTQDRIYEFRLGTAWDISTAVFYDDIYIGFNEITVTGLHVIPEQNVAYIVGSSSDTVFQYSTNTPAIEIASSGISSESSIVLNNETRVKDKLYVKGLAHFDNSILTQSDLTVNSGATVAGTVTAGAVTVTGTLTGNAAVTFDTTTSNINLATSQTTGTLILGGTSQTGAITLGRATTTQITNIQAGTSGVGTTKTINFGTGGASGSFTQINIGPTAGVGTVVINSGTNLGIGTANPTSPLHVVGTALITGITTVGLGTTSTPPSNSQLSFELTSNTNLVIKVRGTDGVLRSANITLA